MIRVRCYPPYGSGSSSDEPISPAAWALGILVVLVLMVLTVGYQNGLAAERECVANQRTAIDFDPSTSYAELAREC